MDVDALRHGAGRLTHERVSERENFSRLDPRTRTSHFHHNIIPNSRDKRPYYLMTTQQTETQTARPESKGGRALAGENVTFF